jgi:hypothetical protein
MFVFQIICLKLADLIPAEVVAEDDPSLERPSEYDVRVFSVVSRIYSDGLSKPVHPTELQGYLMCFLLLLYPYSA